MSRNAKIVIFIIFVLTALANTVILVFVSYIFFVASQIVLRKRQRLDLTSPQPTNASVLDRKDGCRTLALALLGVPFTGIFLAFFIPQMIDLLNFLNLAEISDGDIVRGFRQFCDGTPYTPVSICIFANLHTTGDPIELTLMTAIFRVMTVVYVCYAAAFVAISNEQVEKVNEKIPRFVRVICTFVLPIGLIASAAVIYIGPEVSGRSIRFGADFPYWVIIPGFSVSYVAVYYSSLFLLAQFIRRK